MDSSDLETSATSSISSSYTPLLYPDNTPNHSPSSSSSSSSNEKRSYSWWIGLSLTTVLLLGLVALISYGPSATIRSAMLANKAAEPVPLTRGPPHGVSEKSTAGLLGEEKDYPWTNTMLEWQRTGYHFQPEKNWINDPNGPLYYKGWYHLFYQYNPYSAVWGNITWGHAVSRDMIHWQDLPLAMVPTDWYDADGVWTGSATFLQDGRIVMLYTGSTPDKVQVQNLAFPADPEDPLLIEWKKSEANPVLLPPPGINVKDFRDPTTAWYVAAEQGWRFAIGSKNDSDQHTGTVMIYRTKDFLNYDLIPGYLHSVAGTGMWECIDFYPVSTVLDVGLDTSTPAGRTVKHVLKASMDDNRHDYYAIGTYLLEENKWIPDDPEKDVGIGLRMDYGKFYASKTFYDTAKNRRIIWGWIGETDSEQADLHKGWASLQSIPRSILFDRRTRSNVIQWPIEEVESLRSTSKDFLGISLSPGSVVPLDVGQASQLDIEAEFELDRLALDRTVEADVGYNCSTSGGAVGRGLLGPFGFLVLADEGLTEQTAVYFYVARRTDGGLRTFFCQDEIRSSKANDIVKRIYGSIVPVLHGERLTVRILVDHSIVESFAQGGRVTVTSRIYPTKAIDSAAKLYLFNNATGVDVVAKSVKVWQMDSAPVVSGSERLMHNKFTTFITCLLIIVMSRVF